MIHTQYCWIRIHTLGINCLKASTDKAKQPNWNKTNEMNISLAGTTIFLGKKEHLFCISKHCNKPGPHDNVLSIIDGRGWLDQDKCKNSVFSDFTELYLCNKTTSEQMACISWQSQQHLSVDVQNVARPCSCGDQVVTNRHTTHTHRHGRLL